MSWLRYANQPFQLARLQPHPLGLIAAIPHPLEGPKHQAPAGHQTERSMSIDPTIALAIAPGRFRIQPCQSFRDDPLLLLFAMPNWPLRSHHHFVGADHFIAGILVEKFAEYILRQLQA